MNGSNNMYKFLLICFVCLFSIGCVESNGDIDRILKAKSMVRSLSNYPDTVVFHEFDTNVSGHDVTLKFTCKNAFGVPETHTMTFNVD